MAQDGLHGSLGSLLEIHGLVLPQLRAQHRRPNPTRPPLSLERFRSLRVDEAHHAWESCLPALPACVRTLTLVAGSGERRCGPVAMPH